MKTRRESIGSALSLLLNPSFIAGLFFVVLAARFEPTTTAAVVAASIAVVFSVVIPIASLVLLVRIGRLSTVEMRVRSERGPVYLICAVSYAAAAALLLAAGASWPIWGCMALHVPNTLILMWLNRRWKVSIHTTTISGVCVAGLMFFGPTALPLGVVLGGAAWARWAAGAHTPAELARGVVLGSVMTAGGLAFLQSWFGG